MNNELRNNIILCLNEIKSIDKEINSNHFFINDLNFESIDIVDLFFEIEKFYKINLSMAEFNSYILENGKGDFWDFNIIQLEQFINYKLNNLNA